MTFAWTTVGMPCKLCWTHDRATSFTCSCGTSWYRERVGDPETESEHSHDIELSDISPEARLIELTQNVGQVASTLLEGASTSELEDTLSEVLATTVEWLNTL